MWSITGSRGQNGPILNNQRQFTTFNGFNKKPEQFTNGLNLLNLATKIMPGKSFTNPNFVNKHNPKIHSSFQSATKSPGGDKCQILEKCSKFIQENFTGKRESKILPAEELSEPSSTMCKSNRHEKKQQRKKQRRKKQQQTKRSNNQSQNQNQKSQKHMSTQAMIKMDLIDIDEVGLDISAELVNKSEEDLFCADSKPTPTTTTTMKINNDSSCSKIMQNLSSSPICISIGTPNGETQVVFSISPPKSFRRRLSTSLSECGSEDSFIMFESLDCDEEESGVDEDSDEGDSDDSESDLDEEKDVVDFVSTPKSISNKCRFLGSFFKCKKVQFADDKNLCKVYPMVKWSYAYRNSRKGPWEEYARDSERFKRRIYESEQLLGSVLHREHRTKIFQERFQSDLNHSDA